MSVNPAFSRNIGWLTEAEQESLATKRIAIAGMGGVGGNHLLTLTRLGIGRFDIADFDTFDIVNFNRQVGATISTIDRSKVYVMRKMALDINPNLSVIVWGEGVNKNNVYDFLEGAHLYIDGLDFFAFEARELVFAACAEMKIPAITAAPLGMGASVFTFMPGQMTFEEYFKWEGLSDKEKAISFLKGLSPSGIQGQYLVDPTTINFEEKRGPSTFIGCQLAAAMTAAEALKILLGRGSVLPAPFGTHFDAYLGQMVINHE